VAIALATLAGIVYAGAVWLVDQSGSRRVERLEHAPADYGLDATSVTFPSSDGILLKAWWIPHPAPRGVVVLLHGMDGLDASSLLGHASFLVDAGFAAMVLDMRAHGRSRGERQGFALTETRDVSAALDWIGIHPEREALPLALLGVSMGGAVAIRTAAARREVDAVISLGAFPRADVVLGDIMAEQTGLPRTVVALAQPFVQLGLATVYRSWPASASALRAAPFLTPRPLLIGHGTADDQVPVAHARLLADAAGGHVELWLVEGAGHILFHGDGTGPEDAPYRERILSFLEGALCPGG
jgi:hypothetical protein